MRRDEVGKRKGWGGRNELEGEIIGGGKVLDSMNGYTEIICGAESDPGQRSTQQSNDPGVFPELINRAAFPDRLVLGIDGKKRERFPKTITDVKNYPIGGPGRPCARSVHGVYTPTGNKFELKYGPNPRFRNLYDMKLIAHSEAAPICLEEVKELVDGLCRKEPRITPQEVEFTRDVSIPFKFFENHILARASVRTEEDELGQRTVYAARPRGPWMLRVYKKTPQLNRVEFVFRHSFLVGAGIKGLANLADLKNIDCNRLVTFPAICQHALEDLVGKLRGILTPNQLRIILEWPGRRPLQGLLDVLKYHGLPGHQILRPSPTEKLLADMQTSFVWGTK
jgi:hypothetical protein